MRHDGAAKNGPKWINRIRVFNVFLDSLVNVSVSLMPKKHCDAINRAIRDKLTNLYR